MEEQNWGNLGYYDYNARFYNPAIRRFSSIDPHAEKYVAINPYVYVMNNPIKFIDPTGMSPVYDPEGNFLGTDNQGLKGQPIVMSSDKFTQGMDAEEANSQHWDMNHEDAYKKMEEHQKNLPNRPDYDGKLTIGEANEWYRNGNGKPLFVNAEKIDLSPVKTNDLKEGEGVYINFASPQYANIETGLVYGNIKITLLDQNGTVKLGGKDGLLDNYGFEMHKGGLSFRNIATKIGKAVAGNGTSFNIYNYNNGKVKK